MQARRAWLLFGVVLLLGSGCNPSQSTVSSYSSDAIPSVTNTPSLKQLLPALGDRRFDALERQLDTYQADFEHNIVREEAVQLGFAAFAAANPKDGELLQEWATKSPRSFAAHLALGDYLIHQGWITRGEGLADTVSESRAQRMTTFFNHGREEVEAALRLNPRVTPAYALLIRAGRNDLDPAGIAAIAQRGLKQVPASFLIRVAYTEALLPRWGGSHDAMDDFANDHSSTQHRTREYECCWGWSIGIEGITSSARIRMLRSISTIVHLNTATIIAFMSVAEMRNITQRTIRRRFGTVTARSSFSLPESMVIQSAPGPKLAWAIRKRS